jgi:hypothetical protein
MLQDLEYLLSRTNPCAVVYTWCVTVILLYFFMYCIKELLDCVRVRLSMQKIL